MSLEEWIEKLGALGQSHVLNIEGQTDQDRLRIIEQLSSVEKSYSGGLSAYVRNAKRLLDQVVRNENLYNGMKPSIPPVTEINPSNMDEILMYERAGRECLCKTAFVLVAGGLGERLGYPDIKLKLYTQVTKPISYLEFYCKAIKRCQKIAECQRPFYIMTSDDTHQRTVDFLQRNSYFGLNQELIIIEKQEKVPALADMSATIAMQSKDSVAMKPHGHGDIHTLLMKHFEDFREKHHTEWLFFFQDTNALAMRVLLILLGVSAIKGHAMNSLGIPRKVGEAVGAICKLEKNPTDNLVINVEYCQLDGLLQASSMTEGEDEKSIFPGNANVFVLNMADYGRVLKNSAGLVPEFINPKFADSEKKIFKSPARLECMMQDLPRCFEPNQIHGCTVLPRWISFSTCKNSTQDVAKNPELGACPFTAECDLYYNAVNCVKLAAEYKGVQFHVAEPMEQTFLGVKCSMPPRLIIDPETAISFTDLIEELKDVDKLELTHNRVMYLTSSQKFHSEETPRLVPLKEEELSNPNVSPNYKVRGYWTMDASYFLPKD